MPVASLSTGHELGLLVVAGVVIAFSVVSAFLAPRRWPDFPGPRLGTYIAVSLLLFVAMLAAVELFGVESPEAKAGEAKQGSGEVAQGPAKGPLEVDESEYRIQLPATGTATAGAVTFHVVNKGKQAHDLVVSGPGADNVKTPLLQPGESADLKVTLGTGTYELYCSVPGHKQLGMDAKLSVG